MLSFKRVGSFSLDGFGLGVDCLVEERKKLVGVLLLVSADQTPDGRGRQVLECANELKRVDGNVTNAWSSKLLYQFEQSIDDGCWSIPSFCFVDESVEVLAIED